MVQLFVILGQAPGTRPTGDHLRSLCPEPTLVQLPLDSAGLDAYGHFIKAAEKLGVTEDARNEVLSMATNAERKGSPFASILLTSRQVRQHLYRYSAFYFVS